MATYYCDSARPDDTGDGLTPATAKKTVSAMRTLMNNGAAGDVFRFIYGGIWYEGDFAQIFAKGTVGNPMIVDAYGDSADGLPSIRGFLNWTGSGWSQGVNNPDNVWEHAWTGGAVAVEVWNETAPFEQLTWNTDVETTFGLLPAAGLYAVDAASNLLYMSSTTINPNTTGELVEISGPSPAFVYIFLFTNSEYWTFRNIELMGGNTTQIFLSNTTPNTLFGEFLFEDMRSDRRNQGIISTGWSTVATSRSTITARRCTFQNQFTISEANIFDLTYGSGQVVLIEHNKFLNNPQAHCMSISTSTAPHWYQGVIRYNFAYNCGDDFAAATFMHIPAGSSLLVHHNIMIHNGDDGINIENAENVHIWNNTIIDTHNDGINLQPKTGETTCSVKNNLIINAAQNFNPLEPTDDKVIKYGPEVDADYNAYWQTTGADPHYWQVTPTNYATFALYQGDAAVMDANGLNVDPMLSKTSPTGPEHCRPQRGSPLRGAGADASAILAAGTLDFYGNPIDLTAPDIGAIQYDPSPSARHFDFRRGNELYIGGV